jgi:hypothetical protein
MLSSLLTSPLSAFTFISSDAAPLTPWLRRRAPVLPSCRISHRQPRYRRGAVVAGAFRQRLPLYGGVCHVPAVIYHCPQEALRCTA